MVLATHLFLVAAAAGAQQAGQPAGRPMEPILECRMITEDAARLACYDRAMEAFGDPGEERLVVVDLDRIEAVERDGFGLSMPSLPDLSAIFSSEGRLGLEGPGGAARTPGAADADPDPSAQPAPAAAREAPGNEAVRVVERSNDGQVERVELVIADISRRGYDGARVEMSNGQIWVVPNDADRLLRRGDPGDTAEIRRAAMGSFLMRLNGQGQAYRTRRAQ